MTSLTQADWDDGAEARAVARQLEREAYVPDDDELYAEDVAEEYRREALAEFTPDEAA